MKYSLLFFISFFYFNCFSQDQLDSTLEGEALKEAPTKTSIKPIEVIKRLIAKPAVNHDILFKSKVEPGKEYLLIKADSSKGKYWINDLFGSPIAISTLYSKDNSITETQLKENFWEKKAAVSVKKKYGISAWNRILKGEVLLGWNKELCTLSWGEPEDIHKTITAGRTSEQWIYGSSYLYFENGKLTAIQN